MIARFTGLLGFYSHMPIGQGVVYCLFIVFVFCLYGFGFLRRR